jgi:two-component system, NtrC family, response regulator AtoC
MTPSVDTLSSLGVLVVDDEADVRELLVEYFKTKNFDVSSAGDGRAAQAAILKEPARYGLVLTDLQLPGVDGLGVLRTVKQANPSAYVVIVTGYASLDSAIQAVRLGAYDYLTKPFSLGQIDVVLQRVRDRVSLESENRRLARQVSQREGIDARTPVLARLEGIENRLTRIEGLLREASDHRDRFRS